MVRPRSREPEAVERKHGRAMKSKGMRRRPTQQLVHGQASPTSAAHRTMQGVALCDFEGRTRVGLGSSLAREQVP